MKKIINILIGFLLALTVKAQVGTGPAPYCMPLYSQIPCNQPNPSNTPGNGINDFIHSYNTNGATFNIVNNASGCNAQNLAGIKNYRLWGCQFYMICSPGQVITSNFQSGNVYAQGATVFVDWNSDGVYNPITERMTSAPGVPPAAVVTPMPAWTVPVVPAGTYRMRVRCAYFTVGNTIDPCLNYGYGETEEYYVYVNSSPSTMTVNLTSNSPVCIGNMVNITTSVTLGPGSGTCTAASYTYNWTGPNSFTSNVMSPSFMATTTAQSGVYTLNITPPGGCGCGSTNTIQIWVNPNPSTSITNNGPLCQGGNLIFTNNTTGSGTLTYNWTGPNSYTNNIVSPTIAVAQPSNSGTYNFTITSTFANGGVCKATASSSFVVVPVSQISVTPSYTQCQGTTINLNGNVIGTPTIVWNGPNSYTSNLQNPVLSNVTPTMSGNYSVVATFTAPNTTLTCSSTAVSNVSVVPMNPVTAFATANICQNSQATFSANALGSPIYSWTGPNSFTSTNQVNVINNAQPSAAGVYSVNAIFSIGTVSCVTSNAVNINVVPTSSITVIPVITVCNGQGAVLTATAPGAVSYTWTGPNSFNVGSPNTTFSNLNPTFSGIYTVTAIFTNGNITCSQTNSTQLTVKPDMPFTLGPNKTLCYNDVLNIVGPAGASTYTWTGPGFTSNLQNVYIPNAVTNNAGIYTLVVDLNGCKTQNNITVNINNPITWTLTPSNQTICKGESFTVTAGAGNGSGNYAYNWNPSNYLTRPTGSVQSGIGVGTTIYNVSVYDIACPNYTINHGFTLNVNKAPVPNLNLNKNNQCEPFCFIYDSKVKNQSQFVSYNFNGSDHLGDSINVCLKAGQYTLNITTIGNNGCKETFLYPTPIVVYEKPVADFKWNPGTPNTVSDNHVIFYPSEYKDVNVWTWEINGTMFGDKTPTYVFDTQGSYPISLMVTTIHGCKDTLTKVLSIKDEFLLFMPNIFTPNGDGLNDVLNAKGLGIKTFDLTVFDRWGEVIFMSNDINKAWDGTFKGVMCQDDIYVWKIDAVDMNSMKHTKTGHVTLMK
jgi:gliding motility-associated-like protein